MFPRRSTKLAGIPFPAAAKLRTGRPT